ADWRKRISSEEWHESRMLAFQPEPATEVIGTAGAAFGLIGAWLLAALCMLVAAGRGVGVAR
ncbi:ABC transporter permease, partial [Xanthomonas perforans]|nr:ABC transporter permease [Xanthomonas perforans]